MWDLDVQATHQVAYSLHSREIFKTPASGCGIQVVKFVATASHGVCIAVGPNCGAEQAFACFASLVTLIYVESVVALHISSFVVYVCIIAPIEQCVNNPDSGRVFCFELTI